MAVRSLEEIVWALNPQHDTVESLANYPSQFAQEHLRLAGVRCALEVPTILPPLEPSAEVRHNLLLASREALQNVVVHAAATEAVVRLELREESLSLAGDREAFGRRGKRRSAAAFTGRPVLAKRLRL